MAIENRIEAMETELKLMKSEIKQSLVDVRDFLLALKLPPPPAEVIAPDEVAAPLPAQSLPPPPPPPVAQAPPEKPKAGPSPEPEPVEPPEDKLPEEPVPDGKDEEEKRDEPRSKGMKNDIPQINMLANLIRWVSQAKKQLGPEQLPTLLEVYGVSGNLPPEVKEIILQLAEVTGGEPGEDSGADVFSRLILELHGILVGGSAVLRPMNLELGKRLEKKAPPQPHRPLRLKLVLPTGDGEEKEFSLNLAPETGGNGHSKQGAD